MRAVSGVVAPLSVNDEGGLVIGILDVLSKGYFAFGFGRERGMGYSGGGGVLPPEREW